MKYKEKLINLLKEVDEIKKDLEKLKLWCVVDLYKSDWESFCCYNWYIVEDKTQDILFKPIDGIYQLDVWRITFDYDEIKNEEELNNKDIDDVDCTYIINKWNPLDYHHLFMYNKNIAIQWKTIWFMNWDVIRPNIRFDNTKDFNSQDDEVYKEIYNYLKQKKE